MKMGKIIILTQNAAISCPKLMSTMVLKSNANFGENCQN
jgi:hypothetical protein